MYMFEREGGEYKVKIAIPVDEASQKKVAEMVEKLEENEDVESVVTSLGN